MKKFLVISLLFYCVDFSIFSSEMKNLLHELYSDQQNNVFLQMQQQDLKEQSRTKRISFEEDFEPIIDETFLNPSLYLQRNNPNTSLLIIQANIEEEKAEQQQTTFEEEKAEQQQTTFEELETLGNSKRYIAPIDVYTNKTVENFIHFYTVKKRDHLIRGLKRGQYWIKEFKQIFKSYGLPEELVYLAIVESNFQRQAVSRASATGIWQFMSATGKIYGLQHNWWLDQRRDPIKATHAAARYLKYLYNKFHSWELAIASYNAGSGRVRRAIKKNIKLNQPTNFWHLKLPRETRGYVPAFLAVVTIVRNLEKYNLPNELLDTKERQQIKSIQVLGGVELRQIAAKFNVSYSTLKELNAPLVLGFTPPQKKHYDIVIPKETIVTQEMIQSLKKDQVSNLFTYRVKKGDNLWDISRKFDVPLYMIKQLNHHKLTKRYIKPNMKLLIPNPNNFAKKQPQKPINPNSKIHQVRSGDSLWKIARAYGVTMNALVKHNSEVSSKKTILQIGDRLFIPKNK